MKNKELEVEINKKDIYLTRLKEQLNEAEDKIMTMQKVHLVLLRMFMCTIRGS